MKKRVMSVFGTVNKFLYGRLGPAPDSGRTLQFVKQLALRLTEKLLKGGLQEQVSLLSHFKEKLDFESAEVKEVASKFPLGVQFPGLLRKASATHSDQPQDAIKELSQRLSTSIHAILAQALVSGVDLRDLFVNTVPMGPDFLKTYDALKVLTQSASLKSVVASLVEESSSDSDSESESDSDSDSSDSVENNPKKRVRFQEDQDPDQDPDSSPVKRQRTDEDPSEDPDEDPEGSLPGTSVEDFLGNSESVDAFRGGMSEFDTAVKSLEENTTAGVNDFLQVLEESLAGHIQKVNEARDSIVEGLATRVKELSDQVESLKSEKETLTKELSDLPEKIKAAETALERERESRKTTHGRMVLANKRNSELTERNSELESRVSELESSKSELESRNSELEAYAEKIENIRSIL